MLTRKTAPLPRPLGRFKSGYSGNHHATRDGISKMQLLFLQLNWIWLQLFDSGTLNKSTLWSARSTKRWGDYFAESYPFNQLPLFSVQTSQTLPTTEKCWRQVPLGSIQEQISLSVQYKVGHLQEKEQVCSIKSSNKLRLKGGWNRLVNDHSGQAFLK